MQYDPRQTHSPKPIEPTGFFTGIQYRPIIGGVIVDTLSTIALTSFYYVYYVVPGEGLLAAFSEEAAAYWASAEGLVASLLLGCLGTMIGGFYAAYKAGALEMKHGALVGIGSILLGLLMGAAGPDSSVPEWFTGLAFAAAIPAGALGGFFAEMFKNMMSAGRSMPPGGKPNIK